MGENTALRDLAVLTLLKSEVDARLKEARAKADALALEAADKYGAANVDVTVGGSKVGRITVRHSSPKVTVADDAAWTGYLKALADQGDPRVSVKVATTYDAPAVLAALVPTADGVLDPTTGELVPGLAYDEGGRLTTALGKVSGKGSIADETAKALMAQGVYGFGGAFALLEGGE